MQFINGGDCHANDIAKRTFMVAMHLCNQKWASVGDAVLKMWVYLTVY